MNPFYKPICIFVYLIIGIVLIVFTKVIKREYDLTGTLFVISADILYLIVGILSIWQWIL